ncbi:MAG: hypothetical protein ACF8PG_01715, partial [Maioricimonas sp. JB045]
MFRVGPVGFADGLLCARRNTRLQCRATIHRRTLPMIEIPVIRWGQPYESMEQQPVVHFET